MSALTPDCDPDMSHCGQPWKGKGSRGSGVVSTVILLAILGVSLAVVTKHVVTDAFDFMAVPVAVLSAAVLARRAARLVARGAAAAAARVPTVGVRRSQPVG